MDSYKMKNVDAKMFLRKSVVRDPLFYDAYCSVSFQLAMDEVRAIPQKCIEFMALKRPVITIADGNGWDIIGGYSTLFLANENLLQKLFILEISGLSDLELEMLRASEFSELLFYQLHRKWGYGNLVDALKKLSHNRDVGDYLMSLSSTRRLSKITGISRDTVRYQKKIFDCAE